MLPVAKLVVLFLALSGVLFGQGAATHFVTGSGLQLPSYTFAALPSIADGFLVYCADCRNADPCAGGGTGAVAQRVGSAWACASGGTTFVVTTTMIAPGKIQLTSASVLTINDGCSAGNPCNILVGSTIYTFTSSATATLTAGAGSGTAKIYISQAGIITVKHPTAAGVTINCTGCTQSQVTTPAFPIDSVPLYNATITAGAWTAIQDLRTFVGGGSSGSALKRGFGASFGQCGGTALTAGEVQYLPDLPYACTIKSWAISADAGTATISVWRVASGTAIPTVAGTINTAGVGLAAGTRILSTTLTDFTDTTLDLNDVLAINLDAVATATCVQVFIRCDI
jgi:hypothetical protein